MKIYIANISNTYNYGSMMMAEVMINYLHANIKGLEIYVDNNKNEDLDRLKQATGVSKIYKDELYNIYPKDYKNKVVKQAFRAINKIHRETKLYFAFNKKTCPYDAIIILGGDDYSEIYFKMPQKSRSVIKHLKKLQQYNKASSLFMIGQTIGPYTGVRKEVAKEVFKDISIYSRDDVSRRYLKDELGVDANQMRDLAFSELKLEKEFLKNKLGILSDYNIKENEYIVVVGSGLWNCYTKDEEKFNDTFIEILKTVKKKYKDKKIVFLAHVSDNRSLYSDTNFINKIKYLLPKNIILVDKVMLPVEARIILGMSKFVITYRMHAAVSTFYMQKPAIAISYSPKYMGVIGEGLNMKNLVIETSKENFKKEKIVYDLKKKMAFIDENYDSIIKKVKVKITEIKKINDNALKDILNKLVEKDKNE